MHVFDYEISVLSLASKFRLNNTKFLPAYPSKIDCLLTKFNCIESLECDICQQISLGKVSLRAGQKRYGIQITWFTAWRNLSGKYRNVLSVRQTNFNITKVLVSVNIEPQRHIRHLRRTISFVTYVLEMLKKTSILKWRNQPIYWSSHSVSNSIHQMTPLFQSILVTVSSHPITSNLWRFISNL